MYRLWTAKPGAGCSSLAILLSAALERAGREVLLVDLGGDLPLMLDGIVPPADDGATDWMAASAGPAALDRITRRVSPGVTLLPRGHAASWPHERVGDLAAALGSCWPRREVVVDLGWVDASPEAASSALQRTRRTLARSEGSVLVTRPCYVALRRAVALPFRPAAVAVVREAGRGIDEAALCDALGVPLAATVDVDPAVARATDAGRLLRRPPRLALRQAEGVLS